MFKVIVVDIVRLISIIFDCFLSVVVFFVPIFVFYSFSAFVLLIEHFIIGFSLSVILLFKILFFKNLF